MFSKEQLELLLRRTMDQLGIEEEDSKKNDSSSKSKKNPICDLTPAQIIVVTALLCGALEVDSFLVDKAQQIQIVLTGSLKKKTELEKMMDEVGTKPFDEVMRTLLGRY